MRAFGFHAGLNGETFDPSHIADADARYYYAMGYVSGANLHFQLKRI